MCKCLDLTRTHRQEGSLALRTCWPGSESLSCSKRELTVFSPWQANTDHEAVIMESTQRRVFYQNIFYVDHEDGKGFFFLVSLKQNLLGQIVEIESLEELVEEWRSAMASIHWLLVCIHCRHNVQRCIFLCVCASSFVLKYLIVCIFVCLLSRCSNPMCTYDLT